MTGSATTPAGTEAEVVALLRRAARLQRLARALSYPAPGHAQEVVALLESGDEDEILQPVLAAWRAADEAAARAEYVRLFLGTVPCPPNETAWGASKGLTGGAADLADIQGFYHAFGFEPAGEAREMPDHVAVELEFLAALLVKLAYARIQDWVEPAAITRDAAHAFLEDHLGRWVNPFANQLRKLDATTPYRETAVALEAAVAAECDAMGARPVRTTALPVLADPGPFQCPGPAA
jgi:putative dimethyl sulfoxide reductase chaperone